MTETSVVRENLMTQRDYTCYCGNGLPRGAVGGCSNPRTVWFPEKQQFIYHECGWMSQFPEEFIARYKKKWNI